jgi:hypothetical protein
MQAWLFVLMTVSDQPSQQMDDKICRTAMARMLDLRNILELVNDRLNDGSFAQQQFIREMHEMILHVFAQPGDELKPMFKEQLREGSGNVAAIPKQLAPQPFDQARHRSAIIDGQESDNTPAGRLDH